MKTIQAQGESRHRMAGLQKRIINAIDQYCKEQEYEVTYAEILNTLAKVSQDYAGDILKKEWEEEDHAES